MSPHRNFRARLMASAQKYTAGANPLMALTTLIFRSSWPDERVFAKKVAGKFGLQIGGEKKVVKLHTFRGRAHCLLAVFFFVMIRRRQLEGMCE